MLRRTFTVALVVLISQLAALGAEIAVLRNGFSIRHERREQIGDTTRLYTDGGYVDVPTAQIVSFEVDDAPAAPQPAEIQQPPQTPQTAPAAAQPIAAATPATLDEVVREASAKRQLDPDFVNSVIKAESNFYPHAVSPKGAQGLMQLMPGTAAKLGVSDPFDPRANVEAGTTYLSELLDLYNNDPIKALAAYNAGPQRVQQYHGVPPYRETKLYIARIVRDYNAKKAKQKPPIKTAQSPDNQKTAKGTSHQSSHSAKARSKTKDAQASLAVPDAASGTR